MSCHIQWKHRWKPHVPWITYQNNVWFHLSSHWTSRFMDQNKTNWTQKQYFIIINHYSNYHLHCQFIFFRWQNFYITICEWTSIQKWKRSDLLSLYLLHFGMLPCSNFDSSSPVFREWKWLSLFAAKDSAIYSTTWLTTNKKNPTVWLFLNTYSHGKLKHWNNIP